MNLSILWKGFPKMPTYPLDRIHIDHVFRNHPYKMREAHQHARYEIYYLADIKGSGQVTIADQTYPLTKNCLVLIDQHTPHRNDLSQADFHERYLLELDPTIFDTDSDKLVHVPISLFFQQNTGVYQLDQSTLRQIKQVLLSIYDESLFNEIYFEDLVRLRVLEIVLLLNRFFENQTLTSGKFSVAQKQTIEPVVKYINEHFSEDLSLTQLAEQFYLSKAYLARAFKGGTGKTLHAYLNDCRLKHAQRLLLLYPSYSIDEVAELCGFNSTSYFTKQFRLHTSLTPSQFRKAY